VAERELMLYDTDGVGPPAEAVPSRVEEAVPSRVEEAHPPAQDRQQGLQRPVEGAAPPADVSAATVAWYALLGVVLTGWFLFGWLVQDQGLVDSVGESLGTAFALLLAVSVVGTIRRSRR
jgi:hypothetical protein